MKPLAIDVAARARAALIHLAASAAVAALAAVLVFALWYPAPFGELSGGRELFLIVVAVDVVIGPLITFAVFDRRKPRIELVRDLSFVALLQLAALAYGLHTVALARPAVVALEGDRLRVVRAIDLQSAEFARGPEGLHSLPWLRPVFLATRRPTDAERADVLEHGLAGQDVGMRPQFWLPEAQTGPAFAQAAKPLQRLRTLHPERSANIDAAVAASGKAAAGLGYLPILARRSDWSALVDLGSGLIVGYVPIDGF